MTIFTIELFGLTLAPTYYGLMYALGFLAGYALIVRRGKLSREQTETLFLYVFVGVIVGGRLGYALFYQWDYFAAHPAQILATWRGGMSFHGGALGVILAMLAYAWRSRTNYFLVADEVTAVLPIGLGLGRIGNYLNNELPGYAGYSGPFAMTRGGAAHFPSPLLECALEGIVLFAILAVVRHRRRHYGQVAGAFLLFYGLFRFAAEFVRIPDAQLGYLFGTEWFTMGQLLSLPMVAAGIFFFFFFRRYAVER